MKTILRSSCLCLFYLVQTFIKSLLYVTQYSRSFCVCRLSQPIPIQIYTSLACDKYFCVSFVFLQKKCGLFWRVCLLSFLSWVLPIPNPRGLCVYFFLPPLFPFPQSLLSGDFPVSPLPTSLVSPQMPLLSVHSSHWLLLSKSTVL